MNVQVGRPAPDVAVEAYVPDTSDPARLSPADYAGRWVVLFFYPRDFTFVCPTELNAFAELHDEFAAEEAELVAASTDS